jgi:RimJ/RimL family protein N-acetyltransferase
VTFTTSPAVLAGRLVRLERLSPGHCAGLRSAAAEDRDSYAWTSVPLPDDVAAYVATSTGLDRAGERVVFAQVRAGDGQAVGCTCYLEPRCWPGRDDLCAVEIGATWLAASAQRTGINTEAKLLLLEYAFETWCVARVDLKTDARNARSRAAIERLGARFEGVLRSWSPSRAAGEDGLLRDSAMYSIVAGEWPATKAMLRGLLTRPARPGVLSA